MIGMNSTLRWYCGPTFLHAALYCNVLGRITVETFRYLPFHDRFLLMRLLKFNPRFDWQELTPRLPERRHCCCPSRCTCLQVGWCAWTRTQYVCLLSMFHVWVSLSTGWKYIRTFFIYLFFCHTSWYTCPKSGSLPFHNACPLINKQRARVKVVPMNSYIQPRCQYICVIEVLCFILKWRVLLCLYASNACFRRSLMFTLENLDIYENHNMEI